MKPWIEITEWREFGDDEDSLDVRILDNVDIDLLHLIADEEEIDLSDTSDEDGTGLTITNSRAIHDGEEFTAASGKKYRIKIEEIPQ